MNQSEDIVNFAKEILRRYPDELPKTLESELNTIVANDGYIDWLSAQELSDEDIMFETDAVGLTGEEVDELFAPEIA